MRVLVTASLWTGLVVAAVAACGGATAPAGSSGAQNGTPIGTLKATAPATLAAYGQNAQFNMCDLVPAGDVQSRTPFSVPFQRVVPSDTWPQSCQYVFGNDTDHASVLLGVTNFDTAANALTTHRTHEQDESDAGTPAQQISGVGDTASAGGSDEVGVQAVVGSRLIDANLGGQFPDVSDAAKVAAGTQLVKLILSRLP